MLRRTDRPFRAVARMLENHPPVTLISGHLDDSNCHEGICFGNPNETAGNRVDGAVGCSDAIATQVRFYDLSSSDKTIFRKGSERGKANFKREDNYFVIYLLYYVHR